MVTDVLQTMCFLILVGLFFLKRSRIGLLEIYLVLFSYFYLGPYLSFRLDLPIFGGIDVWQIDAATQVFMVALIALLLGTLKPSPKTRTFDIRPRTIDRKLAKLCTLYPAAAILLFGLFKAFTSGVMFANVNKVVAISMIGSSHYPTLTFVPCLLFAYMALVPAERGKNKAFWVTISLFTMYALVSQERDFLLLSVPIYFWYSGRSTVKLCHALFFAIPAFLAFTALSNGRGGIFSNGMLASLLNQGSNLMAMTQTASFIDTGGEHLYGLSYISGIVNALTLGGVELWEGGASWLSEHYSGGAGAYGYSLEAEAYLNFGKIGVFVLFYLIARYYVLVERLAKSGSHFGLLLKYHFAFFFLYGIRGEFLTILKSAQYTIIIYIFIVLAMSRGILVLQSLGAAEIASRNGQSPAPWTSRTDLDPQC